MNKKSAQRVFLGLLIMTLVGGLSAVSAYTTVDGVTNDRNTYAPPKGNGEACLEFRNVNLRFGTSDRGDGRDIRLLQSFLASRSLLKVQPTGYYGNGTVSAIRQFQRENGLTPTGVTGPLTRAKIKEQTCTSVYGVGQEDDATEASPLNTYRPPKSAPIVDCSSQANVRDGKCEDTTFICSNGLAVSGASMQSVCGLETKFPFQAICSYPAPPYGCSYVQGENFNPETNCGMKLDCSSFGGVDMGGRTLPKPVACTMEARYCQDGKMMNRNNQTCEWLPCASATSSQKIDYYPWNPSTNNLYMCADGVVSHVPCENRTGSSVLNRPVEIKYLPYVENRINKGGFNCTDEMRFCPDGSAMPRGEYCSWKPAECKGGSGVSQDRVNVSSFSNTVELRNTRALNEVKRLEQLMMKSYITNDQRVLLERQRNGLLNGMSAQ